MADTIHEAILYTTSKDGEPNYSISIAGNYITADKIAGVKPLRCWNCSHNLDIRWAAKQRRLWKKHTQEEPTNKSIFLCRDCDKEKNL